MLVHVPYLTDQGAWSFGRQQDQLGPGLLDILHRILRNDYAGLLGIINFSHHSLCTAPWDLRIFPFPRIIPDRFTQSLARLRPRLTLVSHHRMQHDFIRQLRRIGVEPFTPIIADRIRENASRAIERGRADRAPYLGIPLQPILGILVPEMERAVAPRGREGALHGMEVDRVDRIHVADIALRGRGLPMALEAEIRILVLLLDVLDRAAALDGAHGEPRRVREAGHHPRLPFQGTLHRLVEFPGLVEVDHVDVPLRGADHEQLVLAVHRVDAVLAVDAGDRVGLAEVPVFDRLVPRARHEDGRLLARHVDEAGASDFSLVRRDLLGWGAVRAEVEHPGGFVGAGSDDFAAILVGFLSEMWARMLGGFRKRLLTLDQQQLKTGPSCSNKAFPSVPPELLIS